MFVILKIQQGKTTALPEVFGQQQDAVRALELMGVILKLTSTTPIEGYYAPRTEPFGSEYTRYDIKRLV